MKNNHPAHIKIEEVADGKQWIYITWPYILKILPNMLLSSAQEIAHYAQ